MNLSTYEQLEEVDKLKGEAKKNKFLTYFNENKAISWIVEILHRKDLKCILPEGAPPFKASTPEQDLQAVLKKDARKLIYFYNTPAGQNLKSLKREQMFIEFLESLDPNDQKLMLQVKEKKLPFKTINKNFLSKVIPDEFKKW